jgi:hypothetical protein
MFSLKKQGFTGLSMDQEVITLALVSRSINLRHTMKTESVSFVCKHLLV